MTATGTAKAIAGAGRGLGRVAGAKVVPVDANAPAGAVALAEAIADLRDRARHERRHGDDALAAYMLGRASRWPKAWLKRAMRERAEDHRELEYDFDGAGR